MSARRIRRVRPPPPVGKRQGDPPRTPLDPAPIPTVGLDGQTYASRSKAKAANAAFAGRAPAPQKAPRLPRLAPVPRAPLPPLPPAAGSPPPGAYYSPQYYPYGAQSPPPMAPLPPAGPPPPVPGPPPGPPAASKPPCWDFQRGNCTRGAACRFSH